MADAREVLSWSWAYTEEHVWLEGIQGSTEPLIQVLEVKVALIDDKDEFGSISSGLLRLRGRLRKFSIEDAPNTSQYEVIDLSDSTDPTRIPNNVFHIFWSTMVSSREVSEYYCLPLHSATDPEKGGSVIVALILVMGARLTGTYTRVGVMKIYDFVLEPPLESLDRFDMSAYFRRLQEPSLEPDIPCDEFEAGKGYTIAIV